MNKTVTINIAGLVFHIEEDAYARLKTYLETLFLKFRNEEGRDEILADIESRIAEILTQKKGPAREVVIMKDIEEVIEMMGEPEAISDEGNGEPTAEEVKEEAAQDEQQHRRNRRRLFRDPDDRVLGGVCSGLGHYFDVDAVWIRLGFAIMFFVFGTGLLFYFLLMIIIPRAETTAEKLEMKGDPVDVNNIRRSIKEEMEEFGERMKKYGKEAKDWGKHGYDNKHRSRYHRNRRGADDMFHGIFHVIGRLFAVALVVFGLLFLFGLFTGTFIITDFGPDLISKQVKLLFDDENSYYIGITALLLFFGMPIIMMIYSGIVILFRLPKNNKWLGFSALGVWIVGIVLGIISVVNIASGFAEGSEISDRVTVADPHADTLTLRVTMDADMINEDYDSEWNHRYHYERRWKMISTDENTMKFGYAQLNIVPSTSDSIEMFIHRKSQGRTVGEAQNRVRAITYNVKSDSNGIYFPATFTIGNEEAWKMQEVDVELRIPVGTVIFIDASCKGLLWDVANVSDTYDDHMVDRRWKMTSHGLECVDCAGLELNKDSMYDDATDGPDPDSKGDDTIIHHDTLIIPKPH